MSEDMRPARLAVDIGGTFTDLVLEANDRRATVKVLTTQPNPELGVLDGIAKVMAEAGVQAASRGFNRKHICTAPGFPIMGPEPSAKSREPPVDLDPASDRKPPILLGREDIASSKLGRLG